MNGEGGESFLLEVRYSLSWSAAALDAPPPQTTDGCGRTMTISAPRPAADIVAAAEAAGVHDEKRKSGKQHRECENKGEEEALLKEGEEEELGYEFGEEETAMAKKLLEKDERRLEGEESSSSSEWSSSDDEDSDEEVLDAAELPDWLKDIKETGREREKGVLDRADEENVDATNVSPPRTKNEIVDHVPEMPDVPEIADNEEIELVGQIVSVVGDVCVVASEKEDQAPLDETTPLCSEERVGLGFVEEVFGPIIKPMYTMRYDKKKCKSANAPEKMAVGVKIFCALTRRRLWCQKNYIRKGTTIAERTTKKLMTIVNIAMMRRKQKRRGRRIRNRGKGRRKRLAEEEFRHRNFGRGLCRNINCLDIAGSKTRDLRCNLRLGKWHLWVA